MMYVTSHVKHFNIYPIYHNLLFKELSELYVLSSEFNIFEYAQCQVDNIPNFKW